MEKSTESVLHQIVTVITAGLEGGFSSLGTFLDIEGSSDNATFESCVHLLIDAD